MNWRGKGGRVIGHVKHLASCACPLCDPEQTKVKAARARYLADEKARRAAEAAGAPPVVPARVHARPLPRPEADETRRFRELLHERKTAAQALTIIEAERLSPRKEEP
jgi:hypothetical protein